MPDADHIYEDLHDMPRDKMIEFAISILSTGDPIPVDLGVALLEEGIDVSALEDQYG